jgi:hypothetical protein
LVNNCSIDATPSGVRARVAVAAFALALLAGLPAGSRADVERASQSQLTGPCSWAGESDQRDVNIGAPDLDAFYWLNPLTPRAGTRVAITGSYPRARYFSFHVYNAAGDALDSIYDQQIQPVSGSANPYRAVPAVGAGDRYTVYVEFSAKPAHPATNTLYVDPAAAGAVAPLVYRVYVPQSPLDPAGGVPFPQAAIQTAGGETLVSEGACATTPPPFGSVLWQQFALADYPSAAPRLQVQGATPTPTWQRSFGNQLGNQQNAYLVALISRQYGDLVVVHARAPSFPDTRAGQPAWGEYQLRYWSFCTYDQYGQAGIGCAADYGAAIRDGWVTYVVSDPGQRPSNATAANGVTWLPWGGDQSGAQIVYRNMLPSPGFRYAAQRITPHDSARGVMGPYYPDAVYCSKSTFVRGGWAACSARSGARPNTPAAPQSACHPRALPHARGATAPATLIELARITRQPRRAHRAGLALEIELSHSARLSVRIRARGGLHTRLLKPRRLHACRIYVLKLPPSHGVVTLDASVGRTYERRELRA